MSKPNQKKINTAAPAQSGLNTALASALGALDAVALPAGPAQPVVEKAGPVAKMGRVLLRRSTAHRGGKTVVIVHDFATHHSLAFIEELGRRLRKSCGCGGTVHGREIEIQGDQPAKIRALLEAEGFRVAGV